MKNLLSILLVSIILMGCSENRVLVEELTNKGGLLYYEGDLYDGVGFNVYPDGQLAWEGNFKDGKQDGLHRLWYKNGQLKFEGNFKDGKKDGLWRWWSEDGQLKWEQNWKDGKRID